MDGRDMWTIGLHRGPIHPNVSRSLDGHSGMMMGPGGPEAFPCLSQPCFDMGTYYGPAGFPCFGPNVPPGILKPHQRLFIHIECLHCNT